MKMRVNFDDGKVDQSVNFLARKAPMKTNRFNIPLFPISTVEKVKAALIKRLSAEYEQVESRLVYQAVNEADALASLTTVPLLFLPTLAEEKVKTAAAWTVRQRELLDPNVQVLAA